MKISTALCAFAAALACASSSAFAQPGFNLAGPTSSLDYTLTASAQTVLPASLYRASWRIANNGTSTASCTDDGKTPTATHSTFFVYAGGYSDSSGTPVSQLAIQCIGSGAITVEVW